VSFRLYTVNAFPVYCEMGAGPKVTVEGKPKDARFGFTDIQDWGYRVDQGPDRPSTWDTDSGEKIARDIVERNPGLGLIMTASERPTEEELVAAETELKHQDRLRVIKGDRSWENNKKRDLIDEEWRRAVKRLGWTREWMDNIPDQALVPCPFCETRIGPKAKVCKTCGRWVSSEPDPQSVAAPAPGPRRVAAGI